MAEFQKGVRANELLCRSRAKAPHPNLLTRYNFALTKFENTFNHFLNMAADKRLVENIGKLHNRMKNIELDAISGPIGERRKKLEKLIGDEYHVLSENFSFFVKQYVFRINEKENDEFSRIVRINTIVKQYRNRNACAVRNSQRRARHSCRALRR